MLALLFATMVALGIFFGGYAYASLSRKGWRRWGGPLGLAGVYVGMILIVLSALGQARPVQQVPILGPILWGVAFHESDYEIRGIKLEEDNGIFLFLVPKNGGDPLLVRLHWDQKQAEALYERMQQEQVESKGFPTFIIAQPDGFDPHQPLFYDLPQDGDVPEAKTGGTQ